MPDVSLAGALPKGDHNGLDPIISALIDDPRGMHAVIALIDCKKITTNADTGEVVPTLRIRRIEAILSDDKPLAERLMRRALEQRSGRTMLPMTLEDELAAAFEDATARPATPEMTDQTPADPSVRAAAVTKLRRRLAAAPVGGAITVSVNMLNHVLAEHDDAKQRSHESINRERAEHEQLTAEIERLRPMAKAHETCLAASAERQYYNGSCDDCTCCTTAQCAEHRCPENSVGESVCPCTGE